ncbi:Protein kinase-like domain [Pseudocohnilembus persalinus]|uniref:Protein kinase-like domain n=1 Tax=Pseudocohnilembus persalinus TaxID=266149 RepID=A0A0V0QEX1_PSEPJ|nr:Protein kinase-like domain [Pseudocohnilembus persalinus]|eukprot:KRX00743.1 Protein kinase-like domain [Pseudocohnilembus persalinus]
MEEELDQYPEFLENADILDNQYKIIHTIGEGRYAKVKIGIEIATSIKYAFKIIRRKSIDTNSELTQNQQQEQKVENFISEVSILSKLYHKNIIQIKNVELKGQLKKPDGRVFEVMYYVMKLADMGELFQIIDVTSNFSEKTARYYFQQLISGIELIHSRSIAHRDIKPENIVIDKKFNLKICDFGFSCEMTDSQNNKKVFDSNISVGSPEYNPPEISNAQYEYNSHYFADEMDLFSAGTVLFLMVMQSGPFGNSSKTDPYYQRLNRQDKSAFWKIFQCNYDPSQEFKNLIEKMLAEDPDHRLTLEQIKQHEWYNGIIPTQEELESEMKERKKQLIKVKNEEIQSKRQKLIQKIRRMKLQNNCTSNNSNDNYTNSTNYEYIKEKFKSTIDDINQELKRNLTIKKKMSKGVIDKFQKPKVKDFNKQQKQQEEAKLKNLEKENQKLMEIASGSSQASDKSKRNYKQQKNKKNSNSFSSQASAGSAGFVEFNDNIHKKLQVDQKNVNFRNQDQQITEQQAQESVEKQYNGYSQENQTHIEKEEIKQQLSNQYKDIIIQHLNEKISQVHIDTENNDLKNQSDIFINQQDNLEKIHKNSFNYELNYHNSDIDANVQINNDDDTNNNCNDQNDNNLQKNKQASQDYYCQNCGYRETTRKKNCRCTYNGKNTHYRNSMNNDSYTRRFNPKDPDDQF